MNRFWDDGSSKVTFINTLTKNSILIIRMILIQRSWTFSNAILYLYKSKLLTHPSSVTQIVPLHVLTWMNLSDTHKTYIVQIKHLYKCTKCIVSHWPHRQALLLVFSSFEGKDDHNILCTFNYTNLIFISFLYDKLLNILNKIE